MNGIRPRCSAPKHGLIISFQSGEEMDHQQTLGQLLKELRVSTGLTRDACVEVLNRDHLAKV